MTVPLANILSIPLIINVVPMATRFPKFTQVRVATFPKNVHKREATKNNNMGVSQENKE
jgi:hypothetical protein